MSSRPTSLVWWMGGSGFGSQLNLLLMGYLYALDRGWAFRVRTSDWPALGHLTWTDFFAEPPWQECGTAEWRVRLLVDKFRWMPLGGRQAFSSRIYSQVWARCRDEQEFSLPDQGIHGTTFVACQLLFRRIWQLSPRSLDAVEQEKRRLGLSEPYIAIHVRRGDKASEAPPVALEQYMERVADCDMGEIRTCYVMTDDHAVVSRLRAGWPSYTFLTSCPPEAGGHEQATFNELPADVRDMRTLAIITELSLAFAGEAFVGTFSSNIGRLVALYRGVETTYSVQGDLQLPPGRQVDDGGRRWVTMAKGQLFKRRRNVPVPPAPFIVVRWYRRLIRRGGWAATLAEGLRTRVPL